MLRPPALRLAGVTVWEWDARTRRRQPITHHLEELPPTITHALLLKGGRAVACGAAPAVLADEPLSACFGVPVTVTRAGGRWSARATPSW